MFAEWERIYSGGEGTPLIPAATVAILRDGPDGLETLMLRRNSKLEFVGGMWVFPGGRIDPEDFGTDPDDLLAAARTAAVREAHEEAAQTVDPGGLVWFSHWTPPAITPKRFSTWFFATADQEDDVQIDGGEIHESDWMRPADAMARRDALEIELAPPTWVTLHEFAKYDTVANALAALAEANVPFFETRIAKSADGPMALWAGDAGYESGDPDATGPRHRLVMARDGYRYDDSGRP
ncbi:MAG: NUDIX hydrolase [Acidimicrobiales bacterium]|nr:NUDIX hydrolase [Acidimicrobiales bacterium]